MSKHSGTELEYMFALTAKRYGIPCMTPEKYKRIEIKHGLVEPPSCFDKMYNDLKLNDCISFSLVSEHEGKSGNSADLSFLTKDNNTIYVSLKRNNLDLKNPRPSGFMKHVGVNTDYTTNYKKLNDFWFQQIQDYPRYIKMPSTMKKKMLDEFAELYKENLVKCFNLYPESKLTFFKFIFGHNNYIVEEKSTKFNVIVFSRAWNLDDKVDVQLVSKTKCPYIHVTLGELDMNMRLSTCKSSIEKSLALKFHAKSNHVKRITPSFVYLK